MKQMERRTYEGVTLSKKQSEWVRWFEQGSDQWQEAFAQYEGRKIAKKWSPQYEIRAKTWFNRVLKSLKDLGLFGHCPFVWLSESHSISWCHPGFENSGFVSETRQRDEEVYGSKFFL